MSETTPTPAAAPGAASTAIKGFFGSLLDFKFEKFVTRKIASVFYVLGLIAILIAGLVMFIVTIVGGVSAMRFQPSLGILTILGAVVLVPLGTFLSVLLFRVMVELTIAVIIIADNTGELKKKK